MSVDYDRLYNAGRSAAKLLGYSDPYLDAADLFNGWRKYHDTVKSNQVQINYNEYMKAGNQRALNDWQKLYGSKGLSIKYPEFSYAGSIAGYDAGISRSYIANDIAGSNLVGGLPYKGAGLYGVAGRAVRRL